MQGPAPLGPQGLVEDSAGGPGRMGGVPGSRPSLPTQHQKASPSVYVLHQRPRTRDQEPLGVVSHPAGGEHGGRQRSPQSPEGGGVLEMRHPKEKINTTATHTSRFQVPRSPLAPNTPLDTATNEQQMPQVSSLWEHLGTLQSPEASRLSQTNERTDRNVSLSPAASPSKTGQTAL